ncbi:MAG: hypothetical protein Kow0037_24830 [Calditrichia bacterium]
MDIFLKHKTPSRLIAHIDADAFFASVEQGFNPLLRGKLVVGGGVEKQRGLVHHFPASVKNTAGNV